VGAPSGQEDEDDPQREARAYNNCIYLFVAMPYLLLGGVSFLIYRKVKAARKTAATTDAVTSPDEAGFGD
jgi:hypothetical protein